MSVRYEIEKGTNAVKVFHGDSSVPMLYQASWPNGEDWLSKSEAEGWANKYIEHIEDDTKPLPPDSRNEEGRIKISLSKEELEKQKQEQKRVRKNNN